MKKGGGVIEVFERKMGEFRCKVSGFVVLKNWVWGNCLYGMGNMFNIK